MNFSIEAFSQSNIFHSGRKKRLVNELIVQSINQSISLFVLILAKEKKLLFE